MATRNPSYASAESWLLGRVGETPHTSLGWFRAGVGFYNKREFHFAIECFQRSVQLDPLNYNAFQIMARACIAVNRTSARRRGVDAVREGAAGIEDGAIDGSRAKQTWWDRAALRSHHSTALWSVPLFVSCPDRSR